MNDTIRNHYLQFSTFTNAGAYREYLQTLPDDLAELGRLVCRQVIHRVTLRNGNTGANSDQKYGDMERYPWFRLRCEDDVLMTAVALIAELFRLDPRGLVSDRPVENKLVVTCRYVAVLMAAILKSKGIPARCRSGFAPYCLPGISADHWINQYWNETEQRWVTLDADGFFDHLEFNQFDIPESQFDWAAQTWLSIREGKTDGRHFVYAGGIVGLEAAIRAIFYDFHSLMNNEISYKFQPSYVANKFANLSEADLREIDELARLMLDPDNHFDRLRELWETRRKFRILNSPLIGDNDHL